MARVASDGPFSEFAGIDRTLAVVSGSGLELTIGGAAPVVLGRDSDPLRFAGEVPTSARLRAGAIVDLNVMTKRGRFEHWLQRLRQPVDCDLEGYDVALAVACGGGVTLASPQNSATLAEGDAAILAKASDPPVRIMPATSADCYLVLLWECRT